MFPLVPIDRAAAEAAGIRVIEANGPKRAYVYDRDLMELSPAALEFRRRQIEEMAKYCVWMTSHRDEERMMTVFDWQEKP